MSRILIAFALSVILATESSGTPGPIEKRGAVAYSAEDWAHSDTHHLVDVPAQPVGGMKAFLARLDYPVSLRRQNVVGVVKVRVSLDAAGHVLSASIIQSLHPTLDAIVEGAVRQTKWQPAIKAGKGVPYPFRFPVTFSRRA